MGCYSCKEWPTRIMALSLRYHVLLMIVFHLSLAGANIHCPLSVVIDRNETRSSKVSSQAWFESQVPIMVNQGSNGDYQLHSCQNHVQVMKWHNAPGQSKFLSMSLCITKVKRFFSNYNQIYVVHFSI